MWMLDNGLKSTAALDDWNLTPLLAAKLGHVPLANVLIGGHAFVDVKDKHWLTPLHAATQSGSPETVNILLSHGADVNARCNIGNMPLHFASSPSAASLLLDCRADVNSRGPYDDTPLHVASSPAIVNILLNRGARVSVRNQKGWAPATSLLMKDTWGSNIQAWLDAFRAHGWDPLYDEPCCTGALPDRSLEDAGDTNVEISETAFQATISHFQLELATSFTEVGANVNVTWNLDGETPFI
jgi:ankyrin repeat protein